MSCIFEREDTVGPGGKFCELVVVAHPHTVNAAGDKERTHRLSAYRAADICRPVRKNGTGPGVEVSAVREWGEKAIAR